MNYYLVPKSIAESLQLTQIRKSSAGGLYLLSEYDLQPYGIDRAISEGAIELSENRQPVPAAEPEQEPVQTETDGGDSGESGEDVADQGQDESGGNGEETDGEEAPEESPAEEQPAEEQAETAPAEEEENGETNDGGNEE